MFKAKQLCAVLIALVICSPTWAARKVQLDSGYTDVFALVVGSGGKTARLDEGTGLDAGIYTLRESDLVSAGLAANIGATSQAYMLKVLHGDYTDPDAVAEQLPEYTIDGYRWDGTTEVDAAWTASVGTFTATQRAQVLAALSIGEETGVPDAQTFVIKRKDGALKPTGSVPKDPEEECDVFVDFRDVLPSGDAIDPDNGIVSIGLIDDGNEGAQIESEAFEEPTVAELWMSSGVRFTITGGTAGQTDRFRVKVRTVDGKVLSAPCSVVVKDGDN